MICTQCKEKGLSSKISIGNSQTTCLGSLPSYDENGVYHSNDPNTTTTNYECSNGHKWSEIYKHSKQ